MSNIHALMSGFDKTLHVDITGKLHDMMFVRPLLLLFFRSPQFATRATMLSTDALKSKGMYAEAAMQLIKMTSEVGNTWLLVTSHVVTA